MVVGLLSFYTVMFGMLAAVLHHAALKNQVSRRLRVARALEQAAKADMEKVLQFRKQKQKFGR